MANSHGRRISSKFRKNGLKKSHHRSPARKVYAVAIGREGQRIYKTLKEFETNMKGFSGGSGKVFSCMKKAQEWLGQRTSNEAGFSQQVDTRDDTSEAEGIASNSPSNMCRTEPVESKDDLDISSTAPITRFESVMPLPPDNIIYFGESLSVEQRGVLKAVENGKSVFFTGAAGTGKSVTLRAIINMMRSKYGSQVNSLAVTASTGIAALNIGGQTLHSFAGIGLGKKPLKELVKMLRANSKARKHWLALKTLVLDEVSMVDATLFDKIEAIARIVRKNRKPFGGVQLVICGDFFQLPPVPDQYRGAPVPASFAFDAFSWRRCIRYQIRLTQVFRQTDPVFVDLLAKMRFGEVDENMVNTIQLLERDITKNGIEPIQIYPLKVLVAHANSCRLNALSDPTFSNEASDCGRWIESDKDIATHDERITNVLNKYSAAPRLITLKQGAQVMLIKNLIPGHLVNGSLGRVVSLSRTCDARQNGVLMAAEILEESLAAQAETLPSLDELRRLRRFPTDLPDIAWPVVEFTDTRRVLFTPLPFDMEDAFGDLEATRLQVPLILAWAITVHKSQGQTIERLKIDFEGIFESGQAYVAMSRSTGLTNLQVLNFKPQMVRAHPRVLEWYQNLLLEEEMDHEEAVVSYFDKSSADLQLLLSN